MRNREPCCIDLRALDDATGGDREFMAELLTEYVDCSEVTLQAIRAASASGDSTALLEAAHQLKGSSRAIGAVPLGHLLQRLEDAARNGEPAPLAVLEVERAFALVRAEVAVLVERAA